MEVGQVCGSGIYFFQPFQSKVAVNTNNRLQKFHPLND